MFNFEFNKTTLLILSIDDEVRNHLLSLGFLSNFDSGPGEFIAGLIIVFAILRIIIKYAGRFMNHLGFY